VDFIVEDYIIPDVLIGFNYKDSLTSKQLKQFLGTIIIDYMDIHPSDIDYVLKESNYNS